MNHYLQYWKYRPDCERFMLDHTPSDQLGKVHPGDIIWVITIKTRRLYLLGPIVTLQVVSQREAERRLGMKLWPALLHAIAKPATIVKAKLLDLTPVASRLRFIGRATRLPQGFTGRSFQKIRRLTPQSVVLIQQLWKLSNRSKPYVAAKAIDMNKPPKKVQFTTYRVLRDTVLARNVKEIYNHKCQVCHHDALKLADGSPYAEAHHIQPLGSPHGGHDVPGNIICVCPNCHALLDYGAIKINASRLLIRGGHTLAQKYIDYHNIQIFQVNWPNRVRGGI
jgi:5-methylcytosine-specific restriction endonuclease McrA